MSELRSFYRDFPTVKFKKGEIIIHQGEKPKYVYAVRTGVVESYNLTGGGDCRTNAFEIADDIIPMSWAFSKTAGALFYYRAYTDCELWTIRKQDFMLKLTESHRFLDAMLDRQLKGYVGAKLKIDALSRQHSFMKLLYIFRYLSLRYGREFDTNKSKLQIPMTQQEIANLSGLTRETTTLEIIKLKNKGIISSDHRYYTVNIDLLNDEIDDDFNPGISINMLR